MASPPRVSVLIAAYRNHDTIGEVLSGLRAQTCAPAQVIVVESGGDGTGDLIRSRFPEVELVVSTRRLYPGAARNRGLASIAGEVVACLDADCVPDPDWIARITETTGAAHAAVAGAVLNAHDNSTLGWAYYLSEFSLWLPGRPRELLDAPTCNVAYRRGLIEAAGGFTEAAILSADSLLHWRLRRKLGVRLRFAPCMRVRHRYTGTLRRFLVRRFAHGRSLAHARRLFQPLSLARRLPWALAALALLPPFYALRLVASAGGHPDVPTGPFVRSLPLTLIGLTLWAWGQAAGLLWPALVEPEGEAACGQPSEDAAHGGPGPQTAA